MGGVIHCRWPQCVLVLKERECRLNMFFGTGKNSELANKVRLKIMHAFCYDLITDIGILYLPFCVSSFHMKFPYSLTNQSQVYSLSLCNITDDKCVGSLCANRWVVWQTIDDLSVFRCTMKGFLDWLVASDWPNTCIDL